MRRLLPLFLAAQLLAEPPRPADLGDTWVLSARARRDVGGGQDGLSLNSSAVRIEVVTQLTQLRDWQLSLSGAVGAEGHNLRPGTVVGLPRLESVRELDLGLVLSRRPPQAGGPARFYALEISSRTADAAGPEESVAISFAGGSSWKISETFTLGYLILAETREMESDLFLVVPTFRWAFAPEWTLSTGRKSLVLARQFASSGEAFVTVGYDGEETRLEDLAGKEARLLDQRLYADLGYGWVAGSWNLRATLGWELDSQMRFQVGATETEIDPGRGARAGLVGRIRF